MPIQSVPGTDLKYYLAVFDKDGNERREADGSLLTERIRMDAAGGGITDVFFVSHGWKGDVPAAREQYDKWLAAMAAVSGDVEKVKSRPQGFRPLIVGLHWPSLPWGDEEFGVAKVSFGAPAVAPASADALVELYAERVADTEAGRRALRTIFDAARTNIFPMRLPDDVRQAYGVLDAEADIGSDGAAAAPGRDREPFDADRAYTFARQAGAAFGGTDLGGILSPLRQLSFWKMKDRARRFGESGARALLSAVQKAAAADVRFHCMGHSFGCIVVSAMIAGPPGGSPLPRPVDSAMLVQGALSLWSYCNDIEKAGHRAGYFSSIVTGAKVAGPIVTTRSRHDTAVGVFYPLAAGVAGQVVYAAPVPGAAPEFPTYGGVGAFGAQGPGVAIEDVKMGGVNEAYRFRPGVVYNLEATDVICVGGGASGAHSDIAKAEVAHAFWEGVRSGG
jgi:hypothetical protein